MLKSTLPEGAGRVMALVERSAPDPDRPRLSDEWERQLAEVDVKSAACYASMEDLSDQLDRLAADLGGGAVDDGVVVEQADDQDSLVFHVEEFNRNVEPILAAASRRGNGSLKR